MSILIVSILIGVIGGFFSLGALVMLAIWANGGAEHPEKVFITAVIYVVIAIASFVTANYMWNR